MSNNNQRPTVQSNDYNGSEPTRICPNCGQKKGFSLFGWRKMSNGTVRNQSWCKKCRSSSNK